MPLPLHMQWWRTFYCTSRCQIRFVNQFSNEEGNALMLVMSKASDQRYSLSYRSYDQETRSPLGNLTGRDQSSGIPSSKVVLDVR